MDYLTIRHLHITCVMLSGSLFLLRGILMLSDFPLKEVRWLNVVPHLVDTALLASAITLAILSAQYPLYQNWLTAKVVGLIIYVALGTVALKRGKTKRVRISAFFAALIVFVYIGSVAVTKQPLVFF